MDKINDNRRIFALIESHKIALDGYIKEKDVNCAARDIHQADKVNV